MRTKIQGTKMRLLCAVFALIFLTAGLSWTAAANRGKKRVLNVGYTALPGLSETDANGRVSGLIVDCLNEISKYTDWDYKYMECEPEDLVSGFIDGKFDLMGGTFYIPGYEAYFAYPKYSTASSRATLLGRLEDNALKSYDLRSIDGKKIGVYAPATEKIRRLEEFLRANNLNCTLQYYTSADMSEDQNLYAHLRNGEVDLLLANDMEEQPDFRTVATFQAQPYYIVTRPDCPDILSELNMSLERILDSDPDFMDDLYTRYFSEKDAVDIRFTPEEKAYIAQKKNVSVSVVRGQHPFSCSTENDGQHNGLIIDLCDQLSRLTGLTFTYIQADTYAKALQLVQDGEADIMGVFLDTEDTASALGLALSKPYATMNNIVVKNKYTNFPAADLAGAIVRGRSVPSEISTSRISYYENAADAIRAVDQGKADFTYGLAAYLEDEIQKHRYANVTPVTMVNNTSRVTLALARPVNIDLLAVLNKAIGGLSEDEKNLLLDRNVVSIGDSSLSFSDLVYNNPIAFIVCLALLLALASLIFIIITRARVRATMMQNELEKAEAQSKAKGEFLSRMSHEIRTPMNAIVGLSSLTCMVPGVPSGVAENLQKIRTSSQYLLSLINDILDMSRIENGKMMIAAEDFSLGVLLNEVESIMRVQAEQKELGFVCAFEIQHDNLVGDPIRLRQVLLNLLSNAVKFTAAGGTVTLSAKETAADDTGVSFVFSVRDTGIGIAPEFQEQVFGAFEQVGSNISKSEGTGLGLAISKNIVGLMGGVLQLRSKPREGSEFYFTLRFPAGRAAAPVQENKATPDLAGVRILVAEDNDLNAEIVLELLQMQKISAERAKNGNEAVDMFVQNGAGYYQAILMDIQMPEKNGLEAARDIRAGGQADAKTIPIIAMTANCFQEDVDAAKAAGMNGFIAKPVDIDYLYKVLQDNLPS